MKMERDMPKVEEFKQGRESGRWRKGEKRKGVCFREGLPSSSA